MITKKDLSDEEAEKYFEDLIINAVRKADARNKKLSDKELEEIAGGKNPNYEAHMKSFDEHRKKMKDQWDWW